MFICTRDQFSQIIVNPLGGIDLWYEYLTPLFSEYNINSKIRAAAFFGQTMEESSNWTELEENCNYSATALLTYWPSHFNKDNVNQYARQPSKIASRAYANRMGNGDEASGDGWTYRGRGLIQITGKTNYINCSKDLSVPSTTLTSLAAKPPLALQVSLWFWQTNGLNMLADTGDVESVTRVINGGVNGENTRENDVVIAERLLSIKKTTVEFNYKRILNILS